MVRRSDRPELRRPEQIGVLVVSGVRLHRDQLCGLLETYSAITVWGAAGDAEQALELLHGADPVPAVGIVDVSGSRGVGEAETIRRRCPELALVSIGLADVESDVVELAEAGVLGFLTSEAGPDELATAIECAARGEALCSPSIAAALVRRLGDRSRGRSNGRLTDRLTVREAEVARLVAEGLSNKQIARRLSIELSTVKNHVHHILEKLQIDRRGEVSAQIPRAEDSVLGVNPR